MGIENDDFGEQNDDEMITNLNKIKKRRLDENL
jgi:hypothetical protein